MININQTAPSRHDIGRAYDIGTQSITGNSVSFYGDGAISMTYNPRPAAPPVRSHKNKGIKAAKEREKAARASYLRGVAADLIDKRLDFVLHLVAVYHAAKVEAAKTHKRGRVAGPKRQENLVAALAALHGVREYPVKDIVEAFIANLYPNALAAVTRALKRRRLEYRGAQA